MREKRIQVIDWIVVDCDCLSIWTPMGWFIEGLPASRASGVAVPFVVVIRAFVRTEPILKILGMHDTIATFKCRVMLKRCECSPHCPVNGLHVRLPGIAHRGNLGADQPDFSLSHASRVLLHIPSNSLSVYSRAWPTLLLEYHVKRSETRSYSERSTLVTET